MAIPLFHKPSFLHLNSPLLSPRNRNDTFLCKHSNTSTFSGAHNTDNENDNDNDLKLIRGQKLLKDLSTWGIGGPCQYFTQVFDHSHLVSAIRYCHQHSLRFMIIGKGSNCLFDDSGFDGCVILNRIEFVENAEPGVYKVGSGFRFNRLGVRCSNEGFTGLEFAGGIPGTVGGATFMNAGANGQETAEVVDSVDFVTIDGRLRRLERADLDFRYRSSPFQAMPDLAAIVAVTFRLRCSEDSKARLQEYLARRKASQPINEKSAGSVFRNPSGLGVTAGQLIEKAGLKGFKVGGAMISNVHANFFINCGDSSSQDMRDLISIAKERVDEKFGVQLMEEVLYVSPS